MTTSAHPILFSGPMVTALLEGRKTQTRRLVTTEWNHGFVASEFYRYAKRPFQREPDDGDFVTYSEPYTARMDEPVWFYSWGNSRWLRSPYGKAGDLLWVRETWSQPFRRDEGTVAASAGCVYRADDNGRDLNPGAMDGKWRPSIFMPRWASRLTLRVTDVRVEQLQEITAADAIAEGCGPRQAVALYRGLWGTINGVESWNKNPWVWVVSFTVEKRNIDDVLRAAA